MTIGIVSTWFERGAAYVSRQLADVLSHKHEVCIYARGGEATGKGDPNWDLPNVHWGKRYYDEPTKIDKRDFFRWIQRRNVSLLLFNEQRWWPVVAWCAERSIPCGSYVDYYTEETVPLYGLFDFLLCNTKRHRSAFDWHPGVVYVPWGTDTELFRPRSLELCEDGRVVFYHSAGMSPHRKGTDMVLEAFAKCRHASALLRIHTQRSLPAALPRHRTLIDDLQTTGAIDVIEKTVPAPGLYHRGDVYVYPSHLEGIGLTIAEALSCGLPVVTVDVPPMNEFVAPGSGVAVPPKRLYGRSDGYYWPKNDVKIEALADVLTELADDAERVASMKRAAREFAVQHLNWGANAATLADRLSAVKSASLEAKRDAFESYRDYESRRSLSNKAKIRIVAPRL